MASVPGYSHFRLSLSIGGTMQAITDPMENAVRRADRLMYQAKCRKNAVTVEVPGGSLAAPEKLLQEKSKILLVDDSKMNRMILAEILGDGYHILEAENGQECLEKLRAETGNIALVLLDINMPVLDGFDVLSAMNRDHSIEDIPVIMISSEDNVDTVRRAFDLGASDYISRPFDARVVYQRITNTIRMYAKQRRLSAMVADQVSQKEKRSQMMIGILSRVVERRNGESRTHVQHISTLTGMLLDHLVQKTETYPLTQEMRRTISMASVLHDIGKMEIGEQVLNSPEPRTPEDEETMRQHTLLGARMLEELDAYRDEDFVRVAYQICRWHHELSLIHI